jgi:predicted transcriptional regulator
MSRAHTPFPVETAALAAEADAEGLADIAAGRVVPHAGVAAWLITWGTPGEAPQPPPWAKLFV